MDDETERNNVSSIKKILTDKEVDEHTIQRFLRARDQNIEKATAMLLKHVNWKHTFAPKGFISDSEVRSELNGNKFFIQGTDKKGHPIGVAFGAMFNSKNGMDQYKRFIVYILDKLCTRSSNNGQGKFVCIADMEGWGYAKCDVRAYLAAIDILQNNYPERLEKVYLVHVPYLFMKVWNIIYHVIDANTKRKFVFVDDKKLTETLLDDIDESQIPDIYGGKLSLVPIHAA